MTSDDQNVISTMGGKSRLCPSDCPGNSCIDWDAGVGTFQNMLKSSPYGITGDVIKSVPNSGLKDYVTLYNIKSIAPENVPETNCWINCMDTAKCVGYKWDSENNMCTFFSSMTVGADAKNNTDSIKWMCGNEPSKSGENCSFENLLFNRSTYAGGSEGRYYFQPDPRCIVFDCGGNLRPSRWNVVESYEPLIENPNIPMSDKYAVYGGVNPTQCEKICLDASDMCVSYQTDTTKPGNCIIWKLPASSKKYNPDSTYRIKNFPEKYYGVKPDITSVSCFINSGSINNFNQLINICSSPNYLNRPIQISIPSFEDASPYYLNTSQSEYNVVDLVYKPTLNSTWFITPVYGKDGVFKLQNSFSGYHIWGNATSNLTSTPNLFFASDKSYPGPSSAIEMFTIRKNDDNNGTVSFIPYFENSCMQCNNFTDTVLSIISGSSVGIPKEIAVTKSVSSFNINSLTVPHFAYTWLKNDMSFTIETFLNKGGGDTVPFNQINKNGLSLTYRDISFRTSTTKTANCLLLKTNKIYEITCGLNGILPGQGTFQFSLSGLSGDTSIQPYSNINIYSNNMTTNNSPKSTSTVLYNTSGMSGTDLLVRVACVDKTYAGGGSASDIVMPGGISYMSVNEIGNMRQCCQIGLMEDQQITATGTILQFTKPLFNNYFQMSNLPYITLITNKKYIIQYSINAEVYTYATFQLVNKDGTVLNSRNFVDVRNLSSLTKNNQNKSNKSVATFLYNTTNKSGNDLLVAVKLINAEISTNFPTLKVGTNSIVTVTEIEPTAAFISSSISSSTLSVDLNSIIPFPITLTSQNITYSSFIRYFGLKTSTVYKIIVDLQLTGGPTLKDRKEFQLITRSGKLLNSNIVTFSPSLSTNESPLESLTCIYNTHGKTGDDLLIVLKHNKGVGSSLLSMGSFIIVELPLLKTDVNELPPFTMAPTMAPTTAPTPAPAPCYFNPGSSFDTLDLSRPPSVDLCNSSNRFNIWSVGLAKILKYNGDFIELTNTENYDTDSAFFQFFVLPDGTYRIKNRLAYLNNESNTIYVDNISGDPSSRVWADNTPPFNDVVAKFKVIYVGLHEITTMVNKRNFGKFVIEADFSECANNVPYCDEAMNEIKNSNARYLLSARNGSVFLQKVYNFDTNNGDYTWSIGNGGAISPKFDPDIPPPAGCSIL